ncbi:MAG TPA: hypothetical protein VNI55_07950 [Gaiellaceae bacterium]|nr:hypothetical protein [Gaiellaceae bacterium]
MEEQERIDRQLTDFDDPERGDDDERVESGEEAIDESGRNPTQQKIDADTDAEAQGRVDEVDRPGAA